MHDFDPGIMPYPSGLFWIVPVSAANLEAQHALDGRAHLSVNNLALSDYFNIPNALFRFQDPAQVPATCSFNIHWSGPVTKRDTVTSPGGSAGDLLLCQADMQWSASNSQGFKFKSDPHTTSVFAQLGHVRNGIFAH